MSVQHNVFGLAIASGIFSWAFLQAGPLFSDGAVRFWPALFGFMAAVYTLRLCLQFLHYLAEFLEWLSAYRPTGKAGTSKWASLKDFKREFSRKKTGPFWGLMAGNHKKPIFVDFASNALCVAPAGSGKGIFTVIPNIFSIRDSKIIPDFKGELACVMKPALQKRGEKVIVLNPAGLWKDQLGPTDHYNPVDMIVDGLYREGGLRDISGDLVEITTQIYPDSKGEETDNSYFHLGSRNILGFAIIALAMVDEYEATLSAVALMVKDRARLEHYLRWVTGVDLQGAPLPEGPMPIEQAPWASKHPAQDVAEFAALIRANASGMLAMMSNPDSRTFESFISGAQQRISTFAFGPLSSAMGRSTFKMNDLKDSKQPVSLFIVADSSRMEVFEKYLGLIQWCAFTAIKRHKNTKRPVYAVMDEATNYKINGLDNLLTWGRAYGLRCFLIFQNFAAFEMKYGKQALETLKSETEIKLFLPGQRSPGTCEEIVKMLGEQSVMTASVAQGDAGSRENTSESGRPLMTADEIRRTECGILLVRKAPPALITPISYAQINPYRNQAGINPMHGKKFKKPIKLRL